MNGFILGTAIVIFVVGVIMIIKKLKRKYKEKEERKE